MHGFLQELAVPQLRLEGIHKSLGGKVVVAGADLVVNPGESIVLLGPSGCGKSTTLRMVAGFIEPEAGTIQIEGKLVSGNGVSVPTEKRKLGMVFQSYAVWPHRTVFDNVAFGLRIAGESRDSIRLRVEKVLDLVQLSKFADRYPNELSGGQQQRVALARVIVSEPRLLLLDEPLSNLDASLREELRIELRRLHKDKSMTMLYVTHDQEEALVLADRIAVMDGGRVVQFDVPEVVYNKPATAFVAAFIGSPNLIPGRITKKDTATDTLSVRSDMGVELVAHASAEFVRGCNLNDRVTVVIRPEDFLLADHGEGFAAQVTDVSFLGTCFESTLEVNGTRLRARTRAKPGTDGTITVGVNSSGVWAVPCQ